MLNEQQVFQERSAARASLTSCAFAMEAAVNCVLKAKAPSDNQWKVNERLPLERKILLAATWAYKQVPNMNEKAIVDALQLYKARHVLVHPKDIEEAILVGNAQEKDPTKWIIKIFPTYSRDPDYADAFTEWGAETAARAVAILTAFLEHFFIMTLELTPAEVFNLTGTNGDIMGFQLQAEISNTGHVLKKSSEALRLRIKFLDIDEVERVAG